MFYIFPFRVTQLGGKKANFHLTFNEKNKNGTVTVITWQCALVFAANLFSYKQMTRFLLLGHSAPLRRYYSAPDAFLKNYYFLPLSNNCSSWWEIVNKCAALRWRVMSEGEEAKNVTNTWNLHEHYAKHVSIRNTITLLTQSEQEMTGRACFQA